MFSSALVALLRVCIDNVVRFLKEILLEFSLSDGDRIGTPVYKSKNALSSSVFIRSIVGSTVGDFPSRHITLHDASTALIAIVR